MSPLSSPAVAAALAVASFQVTLWITPESFVQVTTVPTATARSVGVTLSAPMRKALPEHSPPPPPTAILSRHSGDIPRAWREELVRQLRTRVGVIRSRPDAFPLRLETRLAHDPRSEERRIPLVRRRVDK